MRLKVMQLKAGDVMSGTGETVIGWSAGLRTSTGKVDIVLEKNGRKRYATWNRHTEVNVEDKD